jgi:hypothetical protein
MEKADISKQDAPKPRSRRRKRKTYKFTILNILAALFLLGCAGFTVLNYKELAADEGWGILGMICMAIIGGLALIVDFILQRIIADRTTVNIVGSAIATIAALALFLW